MKDELEKTAFKELLERYSRGECTPEEVEQINRWYESLGSNTHFYIDNHERFFKEEKLWNAVRQRTVAGQPSRAVKTRRPPKYFKVAAAVAVLITGIIGFQYWNQLSEPGQKRFTNQFSHQSETRLENSEESDKWFELTDGTLVVLRPLSTLSVLDFDEHIRKVELKGEAFFNVTHDPDRPFMVIAENIVTKVLGTSFTVKSDPNFRNVTVAVKTGKVSVFRDHTTGTQENASEEHIVITPNQQVVYNMENDSFTYSLVKDPQVIQHQAHNLQLRYDEEPVVKILRDIALGYGIDIIYEEKLLSNCRVTVNFSSEGLYDRLNIIAKTIGASYREDGTAIRFSAEGCN